MNNNQKLPNGGRQPPEGSPTQGENTPRSALVPVSLMMLSLSLMVGCDPPGKPNPADRPRPPEKVLSFATLYGQNCSGCHGAEGKLGPAPPLNDPLFRAGVPKKALELVLQEGRPGKLMPAFSRSQGGRLTPAQIQVLVFEIQGVRYKIVNAEGSEAKVVPDEHGIEPAWGVPEALPRDAPPYLMPETPPTKAAGHGTAGAKVFERACSTCHGDHGKGVERDGRIVRTIHDPNLLALMSDQVLRRYVITGRPDLGMPSYRKHSPPLTPDEVTDLTSYLVSWRGEGSAKTK